MENEAGLMPCIIELAQANMPERVRSALEQVEATGYGIVMPTIYREMGQAACVRLEACALPSIR